MFDPPQVLSSYVCAAVGAYWLLAIEGIPSNMMCIRRLDQAFRVCPTPKISQNPFERCLVKVALWRVGTRGSGVFEFAKKILAHKKNANASRSSLIPNRHRLLKGGMRAISGWI